MRGWTILAITVIIVSTISGIVVISTVAPGSRDSIGQILTLVIPTLAALSALLSSSINSRKIDENTSKVEDIKQKINGNGDGH